MIFLLFSIVYMNSLNDNIVSNEEYHTPLFVNKSYAESISKGGGDLQYTPLDLYSCLPLSGTSHFPPPPLSKILKWTLQMYVVALQLLTSPVVLVLSWKLFDQ